MKIYLAKYEVEYESETVISVHTSEEGAQKALLKAAQDTAGAWCRDAEHWKQPDGSYMWSDRSWYVEEREVEE